MSITLINQNTLNFDRVFLSFPQYIHNPDILYQMCRFLFNYISWEPKNQKKIKTTKFYSDSDEIYNICLDYEKQIDRINKELSGSIRNQSEVKGNIKVKELKKPKERVNDIIREFVKLKVKTYRVCNNDEEDNETIILPKVYANYEKFKGCKIHPKSIPKKNESGFYIISTTGSAKIFSKKDIKKFLENLKWDSNFQLTKNCYKYARIYIGYDDIEDPSEFTIFLRMMELEENQKVKEHLDKIKN